MTTTRTHAERRTDDRALRNPLGVPIGLARAIADRMTKAANEPNGDGSTFVAERNDNGTGYVCRLNGDGKFVGRLPWKRYEIRVTFTALNGERRWETIEVVADRAVTAERRGRYVVQCRNAAGCGFVALGCSYLGETAVPNA